MEKPLRLRIFTHTSSLRRLQSTEYSKPTTTMTEVTTKRKANKKTKTKNLFILESQEQNLLHECQSCGFVRVLVDGRIRVKVLLWITVGVLLVPGRLFVVASTLVGGAVLTESAATAAVNHSSPLHQSVRTVHRATAALGLAVVVASVIGSIDEWVHDNVRSVADRCVIKRTINTVLLTLAAPIRHIFPKWPAALLPLVLAAVAHRGHLPNGRLFAPSTAASAEPRELRRAVSRNKAVDVCV